MKYKNVSICSKGTDNNHLAKNYTIISGGLLTEFKNKYPYIGPKVKGLKVMLLLVIVTMIRTHT